MLRKRSKHPVSLTIFCSPPELARALQAEGLKLHHHMVKECHSSAVEEKRRIVCRLKSSKSD